MGALQNQAFDLAGRVVLARAQPFAIGSLQVDPPRRQLTHGDRRETLEPRVMQVLVALARAGGAIVTRDELIEYCWDGRIVGDDSINRVISRIRRLAAEIGGRSFSVETIARVGYRLIAPDLPADPGQKVPQAQRSLSGLTRRGLVAGAVATGSLGLAGAAAWLWSDHGGREEAAPEARTLYDQATTIRFDGWPSSNRQAIAYLREAVRISPEFGEAWGALALAYRSAITNEAPERVVGFEGRLREAVRNAEHFDPGNADAAAALLPSTLSFGRWSDREPLYRAAIQRHPDHYFAYAALGSLLMDVGRWGAAVAALEAAKARNPSSPQLRYRLIVSLWGAGRISAAEDEIDRAMQLWPQHGAIWQTKIKVLALTGRAREALALASDPAATPLNEQDAPDHENRLILLTALATGSSADRERAVAALHRKAREVESDRITMALYLTSLGRTEPALGMLEGIYVGTGEWARRSVRTDMLVTHPLFQPHARPLWSEPRFARILQAIGLEDYWRSTGTLPDFRR